MAGKRTFTRYVLRNKGTLVYVGITSMKYPEARIQQHTRDKKFTSHQFYTPLVTEATARKWERELIENYMRTHRGSAPEYNKQHAGPVRGRALPAQARSKDRSRQKRGKAGRFTWSQAMVKKLFRYYRQGLSYSEIADRMDCTPGQIRGIVYRMQQAGHLKNRR